MALTVPRLERRRALLELLEQVQTPPAPGYAIQGRLPRAGVHVVGHNEVDPPLEAVAVALAVGAPDRNEFLEGFLEAIEIASRANLAQLGHACSVLLYLSRVIIQAMA